MINNHVVEQKKDEAKGDFVLQKGMMKEIQRIKDTNSVKFKKGDHFVYEIKDYSWLIQKLAGTNDSTYLGCPIHIPETVLFKKGKAIKVLKTTPEDHCVNQTRGAMDITNVRKHLTGIL